MIAWFVVIFVIDTTSDISKLFYIISRAVRRVKFWGNSEISRVLFMPNITYNSCYYLFILQPEKSSHLMPCVYFRRVGSLRKRANWFWSSCFRPSWSRHWARSMYFSQYCGLISEFSFSSWIYWFQNLEIFPPFLRNSCDEIIWWFWVTIVTVIFTCRYFILSWNTSALSQSNGRNFSGSSIMLVFLTILYFFIKLLIEAIRSTSDTHNHCN